MLLAPSDTVLLCLIVCQEAYPPPSPGSNHSLPLHDHAAAPEILRHKPYDSKSDIYALGCTLYEIVTLRSVYDDQNLDIFPVSIPSVGIPSCPTTKVVHLDSLNSTLTINIAYARSTAAISKGLF